VLEMLSGWKEASVNRGFGFETVVSVMIVLAGAGLLSAEPVQGIEDSIGMQFVLVPAGEFLMGSDESAESLALDYPNYPRD
jgi:formylglycine-generating enzyme